MDTVSTLGKLLKGKGRCGPFWTSESHFDLHRRIQWVVWRALQSTARRHGTERHNELCMKRFEPRFKQRNIQYFQTKSLIRTSYESLDDPCTPCLWSERQGMQANAGTNWVQQITGCLLQLVHHRFVECSVTMLQVFQQAVAISSFTQWGFKQDNPLPFHVISTSTCRTVLRPGNPLVDSAAICSSV